MNVSDPIADMLTRVRNASRARHDEVVLPSSRTKLAIAQILVAEGFIDGAEEFSEGSQKFLRLRLKYVGKLPVVSASSASASPACACRPPRPRSRACWAAWAWSSSAPARGS